MKSLLRFFTPAAGVLAFAGLCSAGIVTFTGEDLNAGPGGPFTNSDAAAANFDAAASLISPEGIINFESAPLGPFSSLTAANGVTITGTDLNGNNLYVSNTPNFPSSPQLDGFNTTPGGANYVELMAGTLTFNFANPVQYFGAYLTGIQANFFQDTITFNDGSTETINVPNANTDGSDGATDFVGFTDAGTAISSITITSGVPARVDSVTSLASTTFVMTRLPRLPSPLPRRSF